MKFINYSDKNLLQIIIFITDKIQKLLLFNGKRRVKTKNHCFEGKGPGTENDALRNKILPESTLFP